jgi:hypothetical protein
MKKAGEFIVLVVALFLSVCFGAWLGTRPAVAQVSHVFGALDVANAWTGIQNFVNGFTYNGGAPSGNYMRGNGTAFVSYTIQQSDLPSSSIQSIASGTAALGTSAISSGSCASVVSVAGSGILTTDTIKYTPNGDPTGVTGYGVSSSGAVLTVYAYPTAGYANFKVCNSTSGSITPGSLTLNWEVTR